MLKLPFLGVVLGAIASLPAQSPLTTLYQGSALLAGPTVYFNDIVVNVPLQITQIDVNSNSPASTVGSLDVYWLVGSRVGNETNTAAWTLGATATVTAAGPNLPTVGVLSAPIVLAPGNYSIAIQSNTISSYYTGTSGTSYSTAEMTLLNGGGSANGPLGTAICCSPRTWNGSIHYLVGGGGGTVLSTSTRYGQGCVSAQSSFYENFATSAAFDLSNTALTMLHTGTGYLMMPGMTTYVAPSGTATPLVLGDDTETTVPLSTPLVTPTGITSALAVCSNGYVSVATGNGIG